jgi:cell division septation protein DedD
MGEDESRGVHLSDKQLVFVFMTATVAAVVVFLFGVLVGRGVQRPRGPIADGETAAAAQVAADGATAEAPVADGMPARGSGANGGDQFSYPARLGKTPPPEKLKAAPSTADAIPPDSAPPDVPAEPVAPIPAGRAAATAVVAAPPAAPYTVQVAAVKRREEADGIVKRLKTKGYDAYVFVPDGDSSGMFRVRVGSFKDRRQADMLAERLLREEKRYRPWVTR